MIEPLRFFEIMAGLSFVTVVVAFAALWLNPQGNAEIRLGASRTAVGALTMLWVVSVALGRAGMVLAAWLGRPALRLYIPAYRSLLRAEDDLAEVRAMIAEQNASVKPRGS